MISKIINFIFDFIFGIKSKETLRKAEIKKMSVDEMETFLDIMDKGDKK